jgi:hypothetical protein
MPSHDQVAARGKGLIENALAQSTRENKSRAVCQIEIQQRLLNDKIGPLKILGLRELISPIML